MSHLTAAGSVGPMKTVVSGSVNGVSEAGESSGCDCVKLVACCVWWSVACELR